MHGNQPQLVKWPDNRRAGVMNLGRRDGDDLALPADQSRAARRLGARNAARHARSAAAARTCPRSKPVKCEENCAETAKTAVGMRQRILAHRVNPACSACHNLMDPIGFALENFDWTGRWRDKEFDGSPIDASGTLPSGEKFNGPAELRQVLLDKKDDFLRHLTGKLLGLRPRPQSAGWR